jgi:atypical dual specificity phosphatase
MDEIDEFTWIVPDRLLACRYPMDREALERLRALGVCGLVNLTELRHDQTILAELEITETHLPVPDLTPPSPDDIRTAIAVIDAAHASGLTVAVHCAAGLGRTGTVMAAWLVTQGLDADAAIARIRELRTGSIETDEQEDAVREFARRVSEGL